MEGGMRAKKASKQKTSQRVVRIKERRAGYAVSADARKSARSRETQLEFHICLPSGENAEEFADKLIELVESYNGTVGGGKVVARQ
jgi:hypothetical protein